jgi:hypothetical protein
MLRIGYLIRVTDDSTLSCHLRKMFAQSFPPADALIEYLKGVDYKKHLNNLITVTLTIAAVAYVLYQNVREWYQNGGKESILQILNQGKNILIVCYTWVRSEGYPALMILKEQIDNLISKIVETYKNWQALVTV